MVIKTGPLCSLLISLITLGTGIGTVNAEPVNELLETNENPITIYTELNTFPLGWSYDTSVEYSDKKTCLTAGVRRVEAFFNQTYKYELGESDSGTVSLDGGDSKQEIWIGCKTTLNNKTLLQVNVGGRFLTQGLDISSSGTYGDIPYLYSETDNSSRDELFLRLRVDHKLYESEFANVIAFLEGDFGLKLSGEGAPSYSVKTGLIYDSPNLEVYSKLGYKDSFFELEGSATLIGFADSKIQPVLIVDGELGNGYDNTSFLGGARVILNEDSYIQLGAGYNVSGHNPDNNGFTSKATFIFRF